MHCQCHFGNVMSS